MSLARADAYPRLFPYITKLTLPPGTWDWASPKLTAANDS